MKVKHYKGLIAITVAVLMVSVFVYASETDERIESSVQKSYVFKTYLKDDSIKTQSREGVVTLTGVVAEESHKALARETVASLPGVKRVDNQLEVKAESVDENADRWISAQVKYALLYNRHVSGLNTRVFVQDGIVTLQGKADNQAQKDLATLYAKDVKGVKDVKNEMTLTAVSNDSQQTLGEKIDDASITAQIKVAFLSHRSISAFQTGVETHDGIVTLSGNVTNAAAKEIAGKVANDANGVVKVINNITIEESSPKT